MALGKTHDLINTYLGAVLGALLVLVGLKWQYWFCFQLGWMFSTFFFGPDIDLRPRKRMGFVRVLFYPYSWLHKHRGLSHHPFFGSLTRIVYLIVLGWAISCFLIFFDLLAWTYFDYWLNFKLFASKFNINNSFDVGLIWAITGIALADLSHVCIDRVTTYIKRI
jgi:uncharacterized metal-binding protein